LSQPRPSAPEPTQIAGRFDVVSRLGAGAFGTVYKAKDSLLGRMVAIKTIRLEGLAAQGASLDELLERFGREARVAAQLKHPNIVTIYDFGTDQGLSYLAMEFIDGIGLDRLIANEGKLPVERAALIAAQFADALDFAHKHSVVHRDIKPANIMIEPGDRVKVTDFGIAKATDSGEHLTVTGSLLGTPSYMSPEQARGADLDGRSDLFAAGCVLYEMVIGKKAFRGDSITGLIFKIITEEPPSIRDIDPLIPEPMIKIIGRALSKAPETRYQSGAELAEDLLALTRSGSYPTVRQTDTPTARAAVPAPAPRRSGGGIGLLIGGGLFVMFFLVLAVGGLWYFLANRNAQQAVVDPNKTTADSAATPMADGTAVPEETPASDMPGTRFTAEPTEDAPPATAALGTPEADTRRATSPPPQRTAAPAATPESAGEPDGGAEYAYLDEEPEILDGESSGRRVADAYGSGQGGRNSGGYGVRSPLRARSRSPRNLTRPERPAVATVRYLMNAQEAYQKRNGRYASLAELGARLDVKTSGNSFTRAGYRFTLTTEDDGFEVNAEPLNPGPRPFVGDDSGFIRSGLD
jgi:tRNA A-37 threonylcarbamoyl transferase component Bud32